MNKIKFVACALALVAPLAWGQSAGVCPMAASSCRDIWSANQTKIKPSDAKPTGYVLSESDFMAACNGAKNQFCTCWDNIKECDKPSSLACSWAKLKCNEQHQTLMDTIKSQLPK